MLQNGCQYQGKETSVKNSHSRSKDSFNKAKESMKKVEEAKKEKTAQELKRGGGKKAHAPKYLKDREKLKAIRHPGPESLQNSRTTTPPPNASNTYGDLKKRVIHILALNNGKYQDKKLKEELSKRNLINGPEAKEVMFFLCAPELTHSFRLKLLLKVLRLWRKINAGTLQKLLMYGLQ